MFFLIKTRRKNNSMTLNHSRKHTTIFQCLNVGATVDDTPVGIYIALCSCIIFVVLVVTAEYCSQPDDCFMENCPIDYTVNCLDSVCTCETETIIDAGEEGTSLHQYGTTVNVQNI